MGGDHLVVNRLLDGRYKSCSQSNVGRAPNANFLRADYLGAELSRKALRNLGDIYEG